LAVDELATFDGYVQKILSSKTNVRWEFGLCQVAVCYQREPEEFPK
jgi:hypothetical protein